MKIRIKYIMTEIENNEQEIVSVGISNIIELFSGVALFLFGMSLMGDGLKKAAGNKLELVLYRLSSTPLKGILLGTGVTAVIQSSSATSVMVVGFVNSGMMKVRQAMGVIMGAIIGTSITGWIISLSSVQGGASGVFELLSTDTFTGIVAVIGVILRMFAKNPSKKHIADVLLGFAVLMFGIGAMSDAVYPLRESERFIHMLTTFSNPIVGILVGILFTSVIQSASAAVGILQALAVTGAIRFGTALPIVMGIAIGAAVPVLLSALGANVDGRRTALSYLLVDALGVIIVSVIFYPLNAAIGFEFMSTPMTVVSIALMNTAFRAVIVIIIAPFVGLLEKLSAVFIKENEEDKELLRDMDRLEERFLAHPALAIEQSRLTVNAMAEKAQENLVRAFELLEDYSSEGFAAVEKLESLVDRYEDKLGSYLLNLNSNELSQDQNEAVCKYLHTINDFERISDHALNIAESAQEKHEKTLDFSPAAKHEVDVIIAAVSEIVQIAFTAFINNDLELAYRVEPLEELIDNLCDEMKLHHIDRLQKGVCTLGQGFIFNDLLTNCERVSDHCSNIAVAMIELESDSFDTHEYILSLNEVRSNSFDEFFKEYSEKYAL